MRCDGDLIRCTSEAAHVHKSQERPFKRKDRKSEGDLRRIYKSAMQVQFPKTFFAMQAQTSLLVPL
jgi:hypothetical protein